LVGFGDLAPQAPGLHGESLAGQFAAQAVRLGVGLGLPDRAGRDGEHGYPAPPECPAGQPVGIPPPGAEQAERHVDPGDPGKRQEV
jgi:hypothetical protein